MKVGRRPGFSGEDPRKCNERQETDETIQEFHSLGQTKNSQRGLRKRQTPGNTGYIYTDQPKYGRYFDPHHPSEHRCRPNTPPHGANLLRYFGWKRKRALESSIAAPSSTITTLPRQDVLLLGQFFF